MHFHKVPISADFLTYLFLLNNPRILEMQISDFFNVTVIIFLEIDLEGIYELLHISYLFVQTPWKVHTFLLVCTHCNAFCLFEDKCVFVIKVYCLG